MASPSLPLDELTAAVGPGQVSTAPADLDAASHDSWPVAAKWARQGRHPYRPDVRVRVSGAVQVAEVLRIAARAGVSVTTRALGSSVTGQPLPVHGGIVLDVAGVLGPIDLDEMDLTVTVPAGVNAGRVEAELQSRGYTMANSPQSLHRSSLGGWVSTMESGQFSSRYGGIEELVVGYVVTLATGETVRVRARPRAAMGPDLRQLFIGAEGTLGVVTEVTVKVFPLPEHRELEAVRVPTVRNGLAVMREVMAVGLRPFLVRFYDEDEAGHAMADSGFADPVLFLGCEGVRTVATAEQDAVLAIAAAHGGERFGSDPVEAWMDRRFDFSSVERRLNRAGGYAETVEVAHTWRHIEALHARLKSELAPLADEVLGHFSHAYTQGTSLYLIMLGQAEDDAQAEHRLLAIWETAMEACLELGAELSHHHGGGLARSRYAARSLGDAHVLLQRLKDALDPEGVLNPGKLGLQRQAG